MHDCMSEEERLVREKAREIVLKRSGIERKREEVATGRLSKWRMDLTKKYAYKFSSQINTWQCQYVTIT